MHWALDRVHSQGHGSVCHAAKGATSALLEPKHKFSSQAPPWTAPWTPQAPFLAHVLLIPSKLALFSRHFKQSWWEGSALLALPCLTWRSGPLLCMVWCLPSKDGHICLLTLPALCEENVPSWSSDEDRFCRLERDPMDLGCPSSLAHYLLTSHPTQIHEDTPCSETNTFCAPHEDALL